MNQKKIALISNNGASPWLERVVKGLAPLGNIDILTECGLDDLGEAEEPYDMFLLDASGLHMELVERVTWLNGRFLDTRIVVLTSSPTWRRARAVLQAGASDYVRRTLETDLLLDRCRSLLSCPP